MKPKKKESDYAKTRREMRRLKDKSFISALDRRRKILKEKAHRMKTDERLPAEMRKKIKAALDSSSDQRRNDAIRAMGFSGDKRYTPVLLSIFCFPFSETERQASAAALRNLGDKRALSSVIHVLRKSKGKETRHDAAWILGGIGGKLAIEELEKTFHNDHHFRVRGVALLALEKLKPKLAIKLALKEIARPRSDLIGNEEGTGAGLQHEVTLDALKVLGGTKDLKYGKDIIKAVKKWKDHGPYVQTAARMLGHLALNAPSNAITKKKIKLVREYMGATQTFSFKTRLLLYLMAVDKTFRRNIPSDLKKPPRHKLEYLVSLRHRIEEGGMSLYETFENLGLFKK